MTHKSSERHKWIDRSVWLWPAWAAIVFQSATFFMIFNLRGPSWSWSIGATTALALLFVPGAMHVPSFFIFLVATLGALNATALACDLFQEIVWFDKLLHLYGGFAVTCAVGALVMGWGRPVALKTIFMSYIALGAFTGIVWEVLEIALISDWRWTDASADLIFDLTGSMLAVWFRQAASSPHIPAPAANAGQS